MFGKKIFLKIAGLVSTEIESLWIVLERKQRKPGYITAIPTETRIDLSITTNHRLRTHNLY